MIKVYSDRVKIVKFSSGDKDKYKNLANNLYSSASELKANRVFYYEGSNRHFI